MAWWLLRSLCAIGLAVLACSHVAAQPDATPLSFNDWMAAEAAKRVVHPIIRPIDSSLRFRPTAEMPGDASVKADLDRLARGQLEADSGIYQTLFYSIAKRLSHTERISLLAHESPVIRAYAMLLIAHAQPDDMGAIEPLLEDPTPVVKVTGDLGIPETIGDLARKLISR